MSQTSDEDLNDVIMRQNNGEECVDQNFIEELHQQISYDNNKESENRVSDEVLNYKREIEKISYLLKEKNLVINKLMVALSNQTQEMINLEKAYHALRQHCIEFKTKKKPFVTNKKSLEPTDKQLV